MEKLCDRCGEVRRHDYKNPYTNTVPICNQCYTLIYIDRPSHEKDLKKWKKQMEDDNRRWQEDYLKDQQ